MAANYERSACSTTWCRGLSMLVVLVAVGAATHFYLTFQPSNGRLSSSDLHVKPPTKHRSSPRVRSDNVTIVTAFFNLGTFAKGSSSNLRGPSTYKKWIAVYAYIENPVVAYFDYEDMAQHFTKLRVGKPTKTIMVDRRKMWAFSLETRTESIFDQPGYPQSPPKSTNAAYVCAMHAKYELLTRTIEEDPFSTVYFAWLDIGLFRDLNGPADNETFAITPPDCYRSDAVAFSKVYDISLRSVQEIMRDGIDWVSGAMVLAESDTMLKFCEDYKRRAEDLLNRGLANHDQSIILSLYAPLSDWRAAVPLQAFEGSTFNAWFYLGYQQRAAWLGRRLRPQARPPNGYKCSYILYK